MYKIVSIIVLLFIANNIFTQNNAQFISQTIPTTVTAGSSFDIELTFENNGTTNWSNVNPNGVFLGSDNPQDNTTWGTNRISLQNSVAVGEQITLSATLIAPSTSGVYNFQWKMLQDGVEWFGEQSENISITVTEQGNSAVFISKSVPSSVLPNENFSVSVKFKNTGTNTWTTTNEYKLGSQSPQDNTIWGTNRITLPNTVVPDEEVTFTFNITAPANEGIYDFQWQIIQEGVEWFGEKSDLFSISVVSNITTIDPSTLNDKVMFGYQGWFTTPQDGANTNPWHHYFFDGDNQTPVVDFWPDISEFDENELFDTGLLLPDGTAAKVPSAYTMKTVKRHMKWLADYELDGVFLQRFVNELEDPRYLEFRNQVLENLRLGCEDYGRTFAVMYDISSSADVNRFERIKQDWQELVDEGKINSPNYLKHNGLPVVSIWGIGFNHFGYSYTAAEAADLIDFFHNNPNPNYRATVMGGVPTYWRELINDSESDPAWQDVYESLDIISPWSVNRYTDNASADNFRTNLINPDKTHIDQLNTNGSNISYLPVVWPGFSWGNLQISHGETPTYNEVPRNNGEFFWKQAYNVIDEGINMLYIAMFDEIDEGTAMFKCAATQAEVPYPNQFSGGQQFISLDEDGQELPSDFYLKLAGCTAKILRGEEPLTITVPDCDFTTNIENISENNAIFVYPNPVSSTLFVNGTTINANFKISDICGKIILSGKLNSNFIDLTNLKNAVYILNITSENANSNFKIIKR